MDKPILPIFTQYRRYYRAIEPILKKPKTKTYSTVIFFFLVLALFGWYAIRPTVQTIFYLRREIKDQTEVSKKMDEKITALIQAQSAYEEAQPLLPLMEEALPTDSNVLSLISQIRGIGQSLSASISGVSVSSVPLLGGVATTSGSKKSTKEQTVSLTLSVDGPYQELRSFVQELLSMRRIIQIRSANFIVAKGEPVSTRSASRISGLRLIMQITAYYLP